MIVPYRRYVVDGRSLWRSVLTVQLVSGPRVVRFDAVVDSGADLTLFPAELAALADVRITKESEASVTAAGGQILAVWFQRCALQLFVEESGWAWRTRVGFAEGLEGPLLGQRGFFDVFRCCFDAQRREMDLAPGPTAENVQ